MNKFLSIKMYEEEGKLLRTVDVTADDGCIMIESVSDNELKSFTVSLNRQLSNEFMVQAKLAEIEKWNPLYYSPAYAADSDCSWIVEYSGLNGEDAVHSGDYTYPKNWKMLIDLIDAMNGRPEFLRETFTLAADYADEAFDMDSAEAVRMVHILSLMKMPQEVITAGYFRALSKTRKLDLDYIRDAFGIAPADLLGNYGDDSGMERGEQMIALLEKVRASSDLYFRRLVLAEVLSEVTDIKARLDAGQDFDDSVMQKDDMGIYVAEIISAMKDLENDSKASGFYRRLVDLYKSVFVSYYLDSFDGVIYQTQGTTAGVMLRRGEYDWRQITESIPDAAEPVTKEIALFLADLWKHEADQALVKAEAEKNGSDAPDLKILKAVMQEDNKKDNEKAVSVLRRMISEQEQIFAPIKAAEPDLELIENNGIDDVNRVAVSFLGLEDDEGKTMAAVFTSMDELGGIDSEDIEAIPVKMLFEFVKSMSRLDGLIIDPFSDRFTISKEKIAEILDDLSRDHDDLI